MNSKKSSVSADETVLNASSAEHSLGSESDSTHQSCQNRAHCARLSAETALNGSTSGIAGLTGASTNSIVADCELELEELEELESESESESDPDEELDSEEDA